MKKCRECGSDLVKKELLVFSDVVNLDSAKYEIQFKITAEYCISHSPSQGGEIVTDFSSLFNLTQSINDFHKQLAKCKNKDELETLLTNLSSKTKKFKMRKVS